MYAHTHAHTDTHTFPVIPTFPNVEESLITKHIHHTEMKKANGVAFLLHSIEHTRQGQIPGNGMDREQLKMETYCRLATFPE